MDTNEIIALGIVALAALLAFRCLFGKKGGGGCCGSGCSSSGRPQFEKKDKILKSENAKSK